MKQKTLLILNFESSHSSTTRNHIQRSDSSFFWTPNLSCSKGRDISHIWLYLSSSIKVRYCRFLFPILAGGEETKAGGLPCIDRKLTGGSRVEKKNTQVIQGVQSFVFWAIPVAQRFLMADHADLFLSAFLLFLFASLMMNINFMPSQEKHTGWSVDVGIEILPCVLLRFMTSRNGIPFWSTRISCSFRASRI